MSDFPPNPDCWPLSGVLVRFADTMSEPANRACPVFRAAVDAADWPGKWQETSTAVSTFLQIRSGGRVGGHHC